MARPKRGVRTPALLLPPPGIGGLKRGGAGDEERSSDLVLSSSFILPGRAVQLSCRLQALLHDRWKVRAPYSVGVPNSCHGRVCP